ncbi:MAG: glycosyltransferase family 2 protein [Fusicatenibacter sp.]|nr:glycosyltransferase family 2 protein [Lachnospiraceae bacterium]MDY2939118.1 glycosyltransferase family 2 protein [Fusicatenibacter sp.]
MAEITVIIPVYQSEQYLERCLDSVLAQTFSDFELLIVDDGSTDGSGQICRRYAEQDGRIRYCRKENGGVSSARNYGIRHAQGNYVMFVDSDDCVSEDLLQVLYTLAKKFQAQMALCRHVDCYEGKIPSGSDCKAEEFCTDREEGLKYMLRAKGFHVTPYAKLYKREIFQGIQYPDKTIAEDAYVIIPLVQNCERIAFTTAQKYYYMHRKGSLTTSAFRWTDMGTIEVWTHNLEVIRKEFPNLEEQALVRYCWARFYVLDKLMLVSKQDQAERQLQRELIKELKRYPRLILSKDHFTAARKTAYLSLFLGSWFYRSLARALARKRDL